MRSRLAALLFWAVAVRAFGGEVLVDEKALRVIFDADRSRVRVTVENAGAATTAMLRVEALRPDDRVVSSAEERVVLPAGPSVQEVVLPAALGEEAGVRAPDLLIDRLRYELRGETGVLARGVRSADAACEGCFRLTATAFGSSRGSGPVGLVVDAYDRASHRPLAGVEVVAAWAEGGSAVLGRTGADGSASLRLLPASLRGLASAMVSGRRGALLETTSVRMWMGGEVRAIVTTDRPLYRPGQVLRVRVLALDWGRVLAGQALDLRVVGPDGGLLDRRNLATSAHGVAHFEWSIPARTPLGDHRIEVRLSGVDEGDGRLAQHPFRVGRYELPVFRLEARSRRSYHLSGEGAEIEVAATTLTGGPLAGAAVRVVRDGDVEAAAGTTDARGRAVLKIDLAEEWSDLASYEFWSFRDGRLDVHVTDPVSRRTESRRVAVRVTREPLHVYWQPLGWETPIGLPLEGWVATYLADGTPVPAEVSLSGATLARVRTDRYGLARVTAGRLEGEKRQVLRIEAHDRAGRNGHTVDRLWLDEGPAVRIRAEHSLLRPGEPARLLVRATPPGPVHVRLWQDGVTLASRRVDAGPGGTLVELAPGRCGAVTAAATRLDGSSSDLATVGLLCPDGRSLSATLTPRTGRARPGAEIESTLRLADGRGRPLAGVAGLVGVDTALLDRARSEEEFGNPTWGWGGPSDSERSGVRRSDLDRLGPARSWSGLQAVAEVLLADEGSGRMVASEASSGAHHAIFESLLQARFRDLKGRLAALPWETSAPDSLEAALAFVRQTGLDPAQIEDPWGNPSRLQLTVRRALRVLQARSPGPDEMPATGDDLTVDLAEWRWYARPGATLERALRRHLDRTRRIPRSIDELAGELAMDGFDLASQKDPWGRALGFALRHQGRTAQLAAWSQGPPGTWPFDAFLAEAPMFVEEEALIRRAVGGFEAQHGRLPHDASELALAWNELLDPWGHPCTLRHAVQSRRADRQVAAEGDRLRIVPVTEHAEVLDVLGSGPDGTLDTTDDVVLARFSRVLSEDEGTSFERPAPSRIQEPIVTPESGAVSGVVSDDQGAAVPGATVTLQCGEVARSAVGDANGAYAFASLPPATCSLRVELTGFRTVTVPEVAVVAGERARIDVQLRVGGIQDVVEVVASAPVVDTSSTTAASEVVASTARRPAFTPRLREYFPETLVWMPEVIVDATGQARVRFPLADSLTTWKLLALASTDDGRVATAEAEVVGALPLSVELDPPPVLTVGDHIELPVPVRNLLEKRQRVQLTLESEPGLGTPPGARSVDVSPDGVVAPAFTVEARSPARRAALTASATGSEEGDRVRKPIEVRADGEPLVSTLGEVTRGDAVLDFEVRAEALPGSTWAELRVLPDLGAHVVGAVEGALQRPWGCAEQLTSSAFPSLLLLEMGGSAPELEARARRYVQRAVDGLVRYERPAGGLGYWTGAPLDAAVSAHALRFLTRARAKAEVDEDRLARTRGALLRAQLADGSWAHAWREGAGSDALLTAQVARALAESFPAPREAELAAGLERAWAYLEAAVARIDEPYLLATTALLAQQQGKPDAARALLVRLRHLEHGERDGGYWELKTNTPFFGWGAAGRVETTGLVLQALARLGEAPDPQADRALRFLLRRQDGFGVWWTSQATVNVLEGLVAHLKNLPRAAAAAGPVEVWLDGESAGQLAWPDPGVASGPLLVDLGPGLQPGAHRLELRGAPQGPASLQLVLGQARPWSEPERTPALRYVVAYDRRELRIGEPVLVSVSAERAGFRGHGMLLAEVGLPPGADVDRGSLEAALQEHRGLYAYEVQPDRVVLYLWPTAGGLRTSFRFRPRYALAAQTAPSELYDYYNPEQSTRLRPARFVVRP